MTAVMETRTLSVEARVPARPSRQDLQEEAVFAVAMETRCSFAMASRFVGWLALTVEKMHSDEVAPGEEYRFGQDWDEELGRDVLYYHPNQVQLDCYHPFMDIVMPDDTKSRPGSAHAAIEAYLLDPGLGESRLVHTKTADEARDCAVVITLS